VPPYTPAPQGPLPPTVTPKPAGPVEPGSTPQQRNLADVEASIQWTQAFLAKL
jgi:hypothetical protein